MLYRNADKEDVQKIVDFALTELRQELHPGHIGHDIAHYPSEIAEDEKGLLGFAVSEEITEDVLFVHSLVVRQQERCGPAGRQLLELLESKAIERGYYGIVVSSHVQRSLLGCVTDELTFAGYRTIYDTGGSRLLLKCLA